MSDYVLSRVGSQYRVIFGQSVIAFIQPRRNGYTMIFGRDRYSIDYPTQGLLLAVRLHERNLADV